MRLHLTVRRPWMFASPLLLSRVAWAARSTAFRGQWSLGDLIGALVIVGLLGGLIAFFFWPRRPS
jgi:bacteriorhodopsin